MKRPRTKFIALTISVCVLSCLPALTQTPGKFGLPASKAPTNAQQVPGTGHATAIATPTPSAIPTPAPGSALAGTNNMFHPPKYVAVIMVGSKQGPIGNNGRIFPLKYQFQPGRSTDATGKLQNGPISFTKGWDASSMSILKALETNEPLTSVTFEFRTDTGNVVYTVTLEGAFVISMNQSIDGVNALLMEEVRLGYRKIEIQDNTTNPATQVASASY